MVDQAKEVTVHELIASPFMVSTSCFAQVSRTG
jgi:hypothetical protein